MKYDSTMISHFLTIAELLLKYFQQMAALAWASISLAFPGQNLGGEETWANSYPPQLVLRGGRAIYLSGPHFLQEGGFPGFVAIGDQPLPVGNKAAAKPPGSGSSCALDEE